jgi:hypothetical protein
MVSGSLSQLWTFSQNPPPPPPYGCDVLPGKFLHGTLLSVSYHAGAKFGTWTVVGLNGTLVEAKMFTFNLEHAFYLQQVSHLDP